jgi:hypothetical protein
MPRSAPTVWNVELPSLPGVEFERVAGFEGEIPASYLEAYEFTLALSGHAQTRYNGASNDLVVFRLPIENSLLRSLRIAVASSASSLTTGASRRCVVLD